VYDYIILHTSSKGCRLHKETVVIHDGPKVGIQYVVNYCIPTFGPPCIHFYDINCAFCSIDNGQQNILWVTEPCEIKDYIQEDQNTPLQNIN